MQRRRGALGIKRNCTDVFDRINYRVALSFHNAQTDPAFWVTNDLKESNDFIKLTDRKIVTMKIC